MGARPLGRKIDELIKVPLSKKILFEKLENCHLTCDLFIKGKKRRVSFASQPRTTVSGGEVDPNGIVIVNETQNQKAINNVMAKINTTSITITLSELVRDDAPSRDILTTDTISQLEAVITQLATEGGSANVLVELTKAE